jgi:hypothetical protein
MSQSLEDAGLIAVLLERLEKQRLPRQETTWQYSCFRAACLCSSRAMRC